MLMPPLNHFKRFDARDLLRRLRILLKVSGIPFLHRFLEKTVAVNMQRRSGPEAWPGIERMRNKSPKENVNGITQTLNGNAPIPAHDIMPGRLG